MDLGVIGRRRLLARGGLLPLPLGFPALLLELGVQCLLIPRADPVYPVSSSNSTGVFSCSGVPSLRIVTRRPSSVIPVSMGLRSSTLPRRSGMRAAKRTSSTNASLNQGWSISRPADRLHEDAHAPLRKAAVDRGGEDVFRVLSPGEGGLAAVRTDPVRMVHAAILNRPLRYGSEILGRAPSLPRTSADAPEEQRTPLRRLA